MNAEVWAEIRRLSKVENLSISEIARRMGMDRKTIRQAMGSEELPHRLPTTRTSKLDPYKDHLKERLKEYPRLSGTVLFEEIKRLGYGGGITMLRDFLYSLRQNVKEVYLRIETLPGELAQVDWANCGQVQIGNAIRKLSCFVIVLSYSRMMYLEFTLSQSLEDFVACHLHAFQFFGGLTRKALYDNLKTVVLARVGSTPCFNPKFMEFAGTYLFEPILCNPGRGNEKGKVESGIKYVRGNFLAGKSLISWPQIQIEASRWRDEMANVRIHGTTRERPIDRFEKEKPHLQKLPDKEYDPSIIKTLRATSQALVYFDGNAYSVPYQFAYKGLILKASTYEVFIFNGADLVSKHRRSFERGVVVEDPKHFEGILATKKKAFVSKLVDSFLSLGEMPKTYLEGLIKSELNVNHHIAQIMECVRLYGKTEILQAIDHALKFCAFGAPYLKNIILQQRTSRGILEISPIIIPTKPSWTELSVEEQDLSLYDELFEENTKREPSDE